MNYHTLVVDDTREKREELAGILDESIGLPVAAFGSSAEGLAHIRSEAQHIIAALIDYSFPAEQTKGIELIRALRELNRDCFIALVTSHPQRSPEYSTRRAEAAIAGANTAYSTNMTYPRNGFDLLWMELEEKKSKLLETFGLQKGS
ncbi:MAG: response regulator [Candidatus Peribacteraceae bacterium]|nr:response regulator [Candidatus Peribacteraceae bacterium]MDD5074576.1 response regulator [Candidatus Peribacteraceae bacterium]